MKLDFDFTFNLREHVKIIFLLVSLSPSAKSPVVVADEIPRARSFNSIQRDGRIFDFSFFAGCSILFSIRKISRVQIGLIFSAGGWDGGFCCFEYERMNSSQLFSAFSRSLLSRVAGLWRFLIASVSLSLSPVFLWLVNEIYEIFVASDRSSPARYSHTVDTHIRQSCELEETKTQHRKKQKKNWEWVSWREQTGEKYTNKNWFITSQS